MEQEKTDLPALFAEPLIKPAYPDYIAGADIHCAGAITTPAHGLPVGNGIMGSLVWQATSHSLNLQLNRVDVFGYNSAATGVAAHDDYGYGCGQVRIDLDGEPLTGATRQHLSLADGHLRIEGEGILADCYADMAADVLAIRITDHRPVPSRMVIDLMMLQAPEVTSGTHSAVSQVGGGAGQIWLVQTFRQPAATGYHEFDHYCRSAAVITVAGRDGNVSYPDDRTVRLTLPAGPAPFVIYLATQASLDPDSDVDVADQAASLARQGAACGLEGPAGLAARSQAWWQRFWSKSFINLPGDPLLQQYQNRWIYNLYLSAISQRGAYPAKFSGLIWNAVGLQLPWGAMFWGYNQECLHYPWAAANHGELQEPYFNLHSRNLAQYATAASQQWGSAGIFINETEAFNGPERLPPEIAADLRAFMLDGNGPSRALAHFAAARHPFISRWQVIPTFWTTFTTINASEKAEHFWQHYLYTLDKEFLASRAYPLLRGAAEFYRNFPNLKMADDGYYHIWRTNHHEHILAGRDVIDDLSFIRGVMPAASRAAEILGVDEELRPLWLDIADRLTPYPLSGQPDSIGSISHPAGKATWCQGRVPAAATRGLDGPESPRLRMVENYDVLTLETRDQEPDRTGEWELANQTFEAHPGYRSNREQGEYGYAGGRYILDAARLGRPEYQAILAGLNQKMNQKTGGSANRLGFTTSDLEELQGYGIFSAGLQEGLLQSIAPAPGREPVIRVFPAWDLARAASFQLLAKGGFLVSAAAGSGQIQSVEIQSQLGGTCRIRNPWPGRAVTLYRNDRPSEVLAGSLLDIPTIAGENIKLIQTDN